MIDFGCKRFEIDQILKCALGLTSAELKVLWHFLKKPHYTCTAETLSGRCRFNLTTVQKAVKKLYDKDILLRNQENLEGGGYVYMYELNDKKKVRDILKKIINKWSLGVKSKIDDL